MPFSGGPIIPSTRSVLTNQSLASDVYLGAFVYYDPTPPTPQWRLAGPGTRVGQGVVSDVAKGEITLQGKVTGLSNLAPGTVVYSSPVTITGTNRIAFVSGAPDTITDTGNGFIATGFQKGMKIVVSGAADPANNGQHTIATVIAGTITLTSSGSLANEAASVDYRVNIAHLGGLTKPILTLGTLFAFVDSNPDTITDLGNTFVDCGFVAGMSIRVRGSALNDGNYMIATVAAGTLTLIASDTLNAEGIGAPVTIEHMGTIRPKSNIKVGYALSATELLVDISVDADKIGAILPEAGYFGGGHNGGDNYLVDKFNFITEICASLGNLLSVNRYALTACNSPYNGYFAGGNDDGASLKTTDKLVFATDISSSLGDLLAIARQFVAACNSLYNGYIGGGSGPLDSIDRLIFAVDTCSTITAVLSVARYSLASCQSSNNGYFGGGMNGGFSQRVDKLAFATETTTNLGDLLSVARSRLAACNSPYAGYFAGGWTGADSTRIDKLIFATDTMAGVPWPLDILTGRQGLAGCNSLINGYFGGGDIGGVDQSRIDSINFAVDVATVNLGNLLSLARSRLSACQSGSL